MRATIRALTGERDNAVTKTEQIKQAMIQTRSDFDTQAKDYKSLESEFQNLQTRFREASEHEHANGMAREKLAQEKEYMEKEITNLNRELESERRKAAETLSSGEDRWAAERALLKKKLEGLESERKSLETELHEKVTLANQQKHRYKKLSLSFRGKALSLAEDVSRLKGEIHSMGHSKTIEVRSLQQQLKEVRLLLCVCACLCV